MPNQVCFITPAGRTKLAASLGAGPKVRLMQVALGDGNGVAYVPNGMEAALRREVYRGNILALEFDPNAVGQAIVKFLLPAAAGPFIVREIAVIDDAGVTIALGNVPEFEKLPLAAGAQGQSSGFTEIEYEIPIAISNADQVILAVDPSILLATRNWVTNLFNSLTIDAYTKTQSDDRYVNITGDTMTGTLFQNLGALGQNTGDFKLAQQVQVSDGDDDNFQSFMYRFAAGISGLGVVHRLRRNVNGVQRGYLDFSTTSVDIGAGSNSITVSVGANIAEYLRNINLDDNSFQIVNTNFVQSKFINLNTTIAASFANYYTKTQSDGRFLRTDIGGTVNGNVFVTNSLTGLQVFGQNIIANGILGAYPQFQWATNSKTNFIQYLGGDGQSLGLNAYDINGQNGKGIWAVPYSTGAVDFFSSPTVPDCAAGTSDNKAANTRFVNSSISNFAATCHTIIGWANSVQSQFGSLAGSGAFNYNTPSSTSGSGNGGGGSGEGNGGGGEGSGF